MSDKKNQPEHWPALVKILRQANQNRSTKPVLWVGAGLSVPAGYPSTFKLIEKLNDAAPQPILPFTPDDTTLSLDNYQRSFTLWVEELINQNNKGVVVNTLADLFLNAPEEPTDVQLALATLPWNAIYTTNYDKLLEKALEQTNQSYQPFKLLQNWGLEQPGKLPLYKIHGCVDDIQSWVLEESSYNTFGVDNRMLMEKVTGVVLNHSVVYAGCSMLDPRVFEIYQKLAQEKRLDMVLPGFVLMLKSEWQAIPHEFATLYKKAKVRPVLFDTFDDLPALVADLKQAAFAKVDPTSVNLNELSEKQRKGRQVKELEAILFDQLTPAIAAVIADVWLDVPKEQDHREYVGGLLGTRAKRKIEQAFGCLLDPLADICELLPAKEAGFDNRKTLFLGLVEVVCNCGLDEAMFINANNQKETLKGMILANSRDTTVAVDDRALSLVCEILIDCIGALGTWNKDNLVKQLENPDKLFANVYVELERFKSQLSSADNVVEEVEKEYRRAVARRFDELRIFGIDFGNRVRKYQLEVAYISLAMESASESREMSTEEALTGFERLVILGEAGQGKTTLLQWLTVQCSRGNFEEDKVAWNRKVPVLIKLREVLKNEELPQLEELFHLMVLDQEVSDLQQEWFKTAVADKRAIFMIDGFDEVPLDMRADTLLWLENLCDVYKENHFILTSRPSAYEEGELELLGFVELHLKTMDSKAQHDFIKHWHRAVAIEEDETRSEALDAIGQELFDKLQLQPSLRSLAQNPLLCGVICMLHRNRSGYLPQSKSDLYQATTEMFLELVTENARLLKMRALQHWTIQTSAVFLPISPIG